jgi:hypothetical protein
VIVPQPLSETRAAQSRLVFGREAMGLRPNLANLIAQAVSIWAYAESNLGNILAGFLKIRPNLRHGDVLRP